MNRKLIFIFLTVFIAAIPFICQIYYPTSDDLRYIALVSGAYTGAPEKELVFVGSILGGIEAFLYSKIPLIEWYTVIYYILTLFSFCTLLLIVLEHRIERMTKCSIVLVAFISQIYLSLTPQFTTLATQLGFTSLITVLFANGRRKRYLWSYILFFFATQMRLVAAFLPFMIAFPLLIKDIQIKNTKWWKKKLYLALFVIVALVSFVSEKYAYRSDEWQYFNRVNNARGYVSDNPFAANYASGIKNKEDSIAYELYYTYRIFDIDILTLEKFSKYQSDFKSKKLSTILYNVDSYLDKYRALNIWIILILSVYLTFELIRKRKWKGIIMFYMCILLFILANLKMMSTSFPKERVLLCPYATLLFITLSFIYHHARFSKWIIICVCLMVSVKYIDKGHEYMGIASESHRKCLEIENILKSPKIDKVMITRLSHFSPEAFDVSKSPIFRKSILHGWMHVYPLAYTEYQQFTSYVDGLPLLVEKDKKEQIELICQLLKSHYDIDASPKVLSESENYQLIKLLKKEK